MAAVIGLAASATEATGERFGIFVGCQLLLRAVLLLQYRRAYRHIEEARPVARLYLIGAALGALLWAVSLLVPRPVAFGLWAAAVLVEALVPLVATRVVGRRPAARRAPARAVRPLRDPGAGRVGGGGRARPLRRRAGRRRRSRWPCCRSCWRPRCGGATSTSPAPAPSGCSTRSAASAATTCTTCTSSGSCPLTLALASIGAGHRAGGRGERRGRGAGRTRLLLAGGVALYLVSMTVTDTGMSRRARHGWWWPLAAAAVALLDVALELPAVVIVGALAALMVAVVVAGLVQRHSGDLAVDPGVTAVRSSDRDPRRPGAGWRRRRRTGVPRGRAGGPGARLRVRRPQGGHDRRDVGGVDHGHAAAPGRLGGGPRRLDGEGAALRTTATCSGRSRRHPFPTSRRSARCRMLRRPLRLPGRHLVQRALVRPWQFRPLAAGHDAAGARPARHRRAAGRPA